LDKELKKRL
jgi:DNA helicase INO80